MALPKIGFNEGSLARRILLHVVTFVLGSMAFIGLTSFVLVSIAKGIVSPGAEPSPDDTDTAPAAAVGTTAARAPRTPGSRPATRPKRGAAAAPALTAQPTND